MSETKYRTQSDAIDAAYWELAENGGGRLVIHADGCTENPKRCDCTPRVIIVPEAAEAV